MQGWRWSWAAAQVTGVLFSSFVWLLVVAAVPASVLALLGIWGLFGILFPTRAGLWWRYGARPATGFESGEVLAALVPIGQMRGRGQPTVWIGRRLMGGQPAVVAGDHDLVVSAHFVKQVANRRIPEDRAAVVVSHARGQRHVVNSRLVGMGSAYCLPWLLVEVGVAFFAGAATRSRALRFSWRQRWAVFALAIAQSCIGHRWPAAALVTVIAILSATTGAARRRWSSLRQRMGDDQVVADGLGEQLAAMIRARNSDPAQLERAADLGSRPGLGHRMSR